MRNPKAEKSLVSVLIGHPALWGDVNARLGSKHLNGENKALYEAIGKLHENNLQINPLAVSEISGVSLEYINGLTGDVTELDTYIELIQVESVKRYLSWTGRNLNRLAQSDIKLTSELLSETQKYLRRFDNIALKTPDEIDSGSAVQRYKERRERLKSTPKDQRYVHTGFVDLDHIIGGVEYTDTCIIAGRPGMGKSSFLLSVMLHNVTKGIPVAFFSFEMGEAQLINRLVNMLCGIDTHELRTLSYLEDGSKSKKVEKALQTIESLPITFLHDYNNIEQAKVVCRELAREGVKNFMFDYLQLMWSKNGGNRTEEISLISRGFKEIAMGTTGVVWAGSQLNRDCEKRQDKRPLLSDLREGSIENEASQVIALYRGAYYYPDDDPNIAEGLILKNRHGPTGYDKLYWKDGVFKNLAI